MIFAFYGAQRSLFCFRTAIYGDSVFVWSAAVTEECVWETLAGILSAGAVSSMKEGDGSQSDAGQKS